MFALNLIQPRLVAIGIVLVAIIMLALTIVDPASAATYGYYRRP
jgi:hypothetical protein